MRTARRRFRFKAPPSGVPEFGASCHYCNVDNVNDAKIAACNCFTAGLRIFDISDATNPREVGYYKPPAQGTKVLPGSQYASECWTRDIQQAGGLGIVQTELPERPWRHFRGLVDYHSRQRIPSHPPVHGRDRLAVDRIDSDGRDSRPSLPPSQGLAPMRASTGPLRRAWRNVSPTEVSFPRRPLGPTMSLPPARLTARRATPPWSPSLRLPAAAAAPPLPRGHGRSWLASLFCCTSSGVDGPSATG